MHDACMQNTTAVTSVPNKDFLSQVEKRFPKKDQVLLLVADANGRSGGPDALLILENAGYVNLVSAIIDVESNGSNLMEFHTDPSSIQNYLC